MKPRENTEWCKVYWYDTGNTKLPRVLLVGDSIVAGYNDAVAKLLKGKATVAYLASYKCVGDPAIYRELEDDYAKGLADYVDAIEAMSPEFPV